MLCRFSVSPLSCLLRADGRPSKAAARRGGREQHNGTRRQNRPNYSQFRQFWICFCASASMKFSGAKFSGFFSSFGASEIRPAARSSRRPTRALGDAVPRFAVCCRRKRAKVHRLPHVPTAEPFFLGVCLLVLISWWQQPDKLFDNFIPDATLAAGLGERAGQAHRARKGANGRDAKPQSISLINK